jgi:hypothetical protein
VLGETIDELTGKKGLDTAAQGARDAQKQAQELSALQWQRQMAGLQEARGQTQPYLSLYDRIYGTQMAGHQTPVGGMGGSLGGPGSPSFDPTNGMNPYLGLMRPDGTRAPTERAKPTTFGGAVQAAGSSPVYAPIMRGGPSAQQQPQMMPPAQQSPLAAQLRPPAQQNGLEQLLARLRGGV